MQGKSATLLAARLVQQQMRSPAGAFRDCGSAVLLLFCCLFLLALQSCWVSAMPELCGGSVKWGRQTWLRGVGFLQAPRSKLFCSEAAWRCGWQLSPGGVGGVHLLARVHLWTLLWRDLTLWMSVHTSSVQLTHMRVIWKRGMLMVALFRGSLRLFVLCIIMRSCWAYSLLRAVVDVWLHSKAQGMCTGAVACDRPVSASAAVACVLPATSLQGLLCSASDRQADMMALAGHTCFKCCCCASSLRAGVFMVPAPALTMKQPLLTAGFTLALIAALAVLFFIVCLPCVAKLPGQ